MLKFKHDKDILRVLFNDVFYPARKFIIMWVYRLISLCCASMWL